MRVVGRASSYPRCLISFSVFWLSVFVPAIRANALAFSQTGYTSSLP